MFILILNFHLPHNIDDKLGNYIIEYSYKINERFCSFTHRSSNLSNSYCKNNQAQEICFARMHHAGTYFILTFFSDGCVVNNIACRIVNHFQYFVFLEYLLRLIGCQISEIERFVIFFHQFSLFYDLRLVLVVDETSMKGLGRSLIIRWLSNIKLDLPMLGPFRLKR